MDKVAKYSTDTNKAYFNNGEFNFTALSDVTSTKFVTDLQSKLLLNKIERLAIKEYEDGVIKIYIYAGNNYNETYIILDCYYDNGYYSIRDTNNNALSALDLTITKL